MAGDADATMAGDTDNNGGGQLHAPARPHPPRRHDAPALWVLLPTLYVPMPDLHSLLCHRS
eukprot:2613605-Rhodomonas_salina.1